MITWNCTVVKLFDSIYQFLTCSSQLTMMCLQPWFFIQGFIPSYMSNLLPSGCSFVAWHLKMSISQDNKCALNILWQLIISLWFGECRCTSALKNTFWKALWWNYRSVLTAQCNSFILKSNNHLLGKVLWTILSWNTFSSCFKWMALCRLLFCRRFYCTFTWSWALFSQAQLLCIVLHVIAGLV